jgi:DNA-binding transcriptional LysR family regulator
MASEYIADGRLKPILTDWSLPSGALYFVTPSARARPAKVDALADFVATRLSNPTWRWPR